MSEIIVPKASVWMEWELDTVNLVPPVIKLNLKPLPKKEKIAFSASLLKLTKGKGEKGKDFNVDPDKIAEFLQANMDFVLSFIIGWNLEINDKPIPITKENKKKYLEPFLWEDVKLKEEDKDKNENEEKGWHFLGLEIAKFCADTKNFIKN